jgi:hypothetical protein
MIVKPKKENALIYTTYSLSSEKEEEEERRRS